MVVLEELAKFKVALTVLLEAASLKRIRETLNSKSQLIQTHALTHEGNSLTFQTRAHSH